MMKFYSVVSALFNNKSKYGFVTDAPPVDAADALVWGSGNNLIWGSSNNITWG